MKAKSGSITFNGVLTCIFIALKLMGHIDWNWFWVLSPIIFTWGFALIILILLGLGALVESQREND